MRGNNYFSVLCAALLLLSGALLTVSCKKDVDVLGSSGHPHAAGGIFTPAGFEDQIGLGAENGESPLKQAILVLNLEEGQDLILSSYLDPALQGGVIAFFGNITGSMAVAELILSGAAALDVHPALAFSLCAEESGFNPRAVNYNKNDTIDRGLFQLNNASFPDLRVVDFYDPEVNIRHGLAHLRWCLSTAGTEVAALAMYNAGHNRVRSSGTPKSTLDYISRILNRQRKIEEHFLAEYARLIRMENIWEEKGKVPFRLSLLTPLGGR